MNKVWSWLGRNGKHVFHSLVVIMVAMVIFAFAPDPVGKWSHNLWIGVDQLANAVTLGDPGETISSRLGKWSTDPNADGFRGGISTFVCFFLDIVDKNHCAGSIDPTVGKDAIIN